MDCFYAAIEMRDNPSLRNKPIAVGGSPNARGVLCTSNYMAREYGVRSAMSSAYAKRLCPNLSILPVNMQKYREISNEIREIFFEYTDLVEPLSLDEAYLDVTDSNFCSNSATFMAEEIRHKIVKKCHLTASAGVAPNKFLAKVASDINKPNGQYVIRPQDVSEFIDTLPVKKIPGVGKVTVKKLEKMQINTCSDLQAKSQIELTDALGKFGARLFELSRGIDDRAVEPSRIRKSISVENTYADDLLSLDACINELPDLFLQLTNRLKNKKNLKIHKQFVKVKFHDFKTTTAESISSDLSQDLFKMLMTTGYQRKSKPVRLLGIGVGFKDDEHQAQQELFL
jgi:DNA polymerase IV